MRTKWDINSVKNYCNSKKLELLSDSYSKMKDTLVFKCTCGTKFQTTFEKVVYRNKIKCNKCNNHSGFEKEKLNNELERFQLTIVGKQPQNTTDKFTVINKENMKLETNYNNLKKSKKLIFVSPNNVHSIDNIRTFLKNEKANVKLNSKVYRSYNRDKLCLICQCGEEYYTTWGDLRERKQFNCRQCGIKKRSGENHYFYNPNLTEEERARLRTTTFNSNIRDFRNLVFERDGYTCQICKRKSIKNQKTLLNAHHLNGFHWFEEGRYDFNNGVTLCETCHKGFHKIYGNLYNTKEQFEEYLKHAQ